MSTKSVVSITALLSFALFMLPGCAVRSQHDRTYVSITMHDRTGFDVRSEAQDQGFELPAGIVISDGLSEDEAVATALWNNAQFQVDLVQLGFARADLIEAGLLRNPVLSLLFPWGPKQLEAYVHLPIDFLWQRPKRVVSAKLNAEMVADDLIHHGLDLVRRVRIAYAELVMTGEQYVIMEEEALLSKEIALIASERLKFGDISGLEEAAFRLESGRAQEAALRFAQNAQQAEYNLKMLLGIDLEGIELKLTDTRSEIGTDEDISVLLKGAFAARPDLRAAEIALEAAGHRIGWERSKVLNFTAILDANGEGKEGFEMGPGLQIELPLLNMNSSNIARAKAELDFAAKNYLEVKQRIAGEVLESHSSCLTTREALRILEDEVLPAAQAAAAKAGESFELGEVSYLDLLEFKRQLMDARLQRSRAEAAFWQAGINLEFSTGFTLGLGEEGGTDEDWEKN